MNADNLFRLFVPVAILAVLLVLDLRKRVKRRRLRRAVHRAEIARWRRETPWSVRAGLLPEELGSMSADQVDDFMRPEDMSAVRRDLEELEKTDEGKALRKAAELRGRRLGIIAAPPPQVIERPADDQLSDEEREILKLTDARAVRR